MRKLIQIIVNGVKTFLNRLKMAFNALFGLKDKVSKRKIDLIYDLIDEKVDFKIQVDDINLEVKRK